MFGSNIHLKPSAKTSRRSHFSLRWTLYTIYHTSCHSYYHCIDFIMPSGAGSTCVIYHIQAGANKVHSGYQPDSQQEAEEEAGG